MDDSVYDEWAGDARMLLAVHCRTSPQHIHIQDTALEEELIYFLVLDRQMEQHKIALPDMYFATFSGVHTLH